MIRSRRVIALALLLTGVVANATPASACTYLQTFFRNTAEGSIAHVKGATDEKGARTLYGSLCAVESQAIVDAEGARAYFVVNNRSDTPGTELYYTVKIFRHSADTIREPLLSLRRSDYKPPRGQCSVKTDDYSPPAFRGRTVVTDFLAALSPAPLLTVSTPNYVRDWVTRQSSSALLPFAADASFLRSLPGPVAPRVQDWSLNVFTSSYRTAAYSDRPACFPIFWVTLNGEDQLIVELSNGSQSWTFSIVR